MRSALLAACLAFGAAGALAQVTPGTVATVNGAPITIQQLERNFEREMRARNLNIAAVRRPDKIAEIKREVLERLIREELLWQKARAACFRRTAPRRCWSRAASRSPTRRSSASTATIPRTSTVPS
ncbi:MAG: SurA N-terminal domain-containing protein, partial [Betaproteobacteria bacterium]|nr:SurA N-terminal domain-containing protein [Betaproteobacteria bacterium]